MGLYATTTTLALALPGFLRFDTTTTDSKGRAQYSHCIDKAEGVVNGYVSKRYSLPFTVVPPIVRTLAEDIAVYFLLRGTLTQDGKTKNAYLDEYQMSMDMLKDIAEGNIGLHYTDGTALPTISNNRFLSSTEEYDPIFGLDDAIEWQRDKTEIEDREAARIRQT